MGYPIDKNNKRISDYYRMLFLLNESTDDYLFLWDLRKNKIYFAKDLPNQYALRKEEDFGYSADILLNTIYRHDLLSIKRIMANIINGSQDSFDLDFRSQDHCHKKIWMNCRGKVLFDEEEMPDIAVGRLSNTVLFDKIDMLTGLRNYNKMQENLKIKISGGKRGHLMIVGIDNFKDINQRFGRSFGNRILKQIADLLENEEDYIQVYRLDGDHFAVDLEGFSHDRVKSFYQDVQNDAKKMCMISAGVVSYPLSETSDTNYLIQYAENALDRAKKCGKNRMEFFSPEDYKEYMYRIELQEELKGSVQNGFDGFRIYYQPQMFSEGCTLYGAEALLRFHSHQYGLISPAVFIPILEQTGLMIPVGNWVMKQAFLQCAKWRKLNSHFHISINVSYIQLREKSITDDIFRALETANLPGKAVAIEITESIQLQDYNYFNHIFYQWREKGIKVAVDDFGTGYSSLGYLKGLEIDEIKIDRCFVNKIQTNSYNYKLLSNMIELAHSARIQVCCEGIESEEEFQCLENLKPELIQGFLFGKPLKATEFEKFYLNQNRKYDKVAEESGYASEMDDKEPDQKNVGINEGIVAINDELEAAKQVIELYEAVSQETDTKRYIQKVIEYTAGFYQADRVLVFLYYRKEGIWQNSFSYCAEGIMPKEACFQTITADKIKPWIDCLKQNSSCVIDSSDASKEVYQELWKGMSLRNIENILISGMWNQNELEGFVCVDNASVYKDEAAFIEKAKNLISQKLFSDGKDNKNNHNLIQEFIKLKIGEDILSATNVGLWMIRINQEKNEYTMVANETMKKVLCVEDSVSPEECYSHWYNRINDGFYHYVNNALGTMMATGNTVEVEYTWNHPECGEVTVRCIGKLISNVNGIIVLEGYHRILDNLNQLRLISRMMDNEIFEFHELRQMIYFHSGRNLIYGNERREEKFPDSWISRGIVHPYFIDEFSDFFQNVSDKEVRQSFHVMLKNKMGEFEWFKIETLHIGKEKEDRNTLIVQILPMMEKKLVELEYNRTNDFYQAILSETIAYAEVNLDNGNILATGGLWENYIEQEEQNGVSLPSFIKKMIDQFVVEEDKERCYQFLQISSMKDYFQSGTRNISLQYQRKINGKIHWIELTVHMFQEKYTQAIYALLYQKDINTDKRRALKNEEAAKLDMLTHALNRNTFEKQVSYYMDTLEEDKVCALMIVDIDNFKEINDLKGHLYGDAILKALTDALRSSFRTTDLIGRLGGDEFMVFVKDIKSSDMLKQRLDKLYKVFQKTDSYSYSCSSGICMVEKKNFQYATCLQQADEALYQSKRNGKNRYTFFNK